MARPPSYTLLARLVVSSCCAVLSAQVIEIENFSGNITIRSEMGAARLSTTVSSPQRNARKEDVQISQLPDVVTIRCQPSDSIPMDLEVTVPHNASVRARTKSGAIRVNGIIRRAAIETDTGDVTIDAPLLLTRIRVLSDQPLPSVEAPVLSRVDYVPGRLGERWGYADMNRNQLRLKSKVDQFPALSWLSRRPRVFTEIEVSAKAPGRLRLIDAELPANSWVRFPAQADRVLNELRPGGRQRTFSPSDAPTAKGHESAADVPVFSTDVRLVTVSATVYDHEGRAAVGLTATDFQLLEDGVQQKLAFASAEELPFDLVLLMDLSGSTRRSRDVLKQAAINFAALARPKDRVAVYALADGLFQVVLPLTTNHDPAKTLIESIPDVSGDSPIYQSIVLSYAQEALNRSDRRTAVVVLTDGFDNSLAPYQIPTESLPFAELKSALSELRVLLYPILLPLPGSTKFDARAEKRMQQLADATGGRVFKAISLADLRSTYDLVAEELRSNYALGYYPTNQNFDGKWRRVNVRLLSKGLTVRTRNGYFAW